MNVGDKVQGVYYGAAFTGTIRATRQHSMNHKITEISIDFDQPVIINGSTETGCVFYAFSDGRHWTDTNGYVTEYTPTPKPNPYYATPYSGDPGVFEPFDNPNDTSFKVTTKMPAKAKQQLKAMHDQYVADQQYMKALHNARIAQIKANKKPE